MARRLIRFWGLSMLGSLDSAFQASMIKEKVPGHVNWKGIRMGSLSRTMSPPDPKTGVLPAP